MKIKPNKDFDLVFEPKYYFLSMCEVDCSFEMIGKEPSLKYLGLTMDHKVNLLGKACWYTSQ